MQVDYTQHSRDQMTVRHISRTEVEETLSRPYHTVTSRVSGNTIYFGRPGGRSIAVVVVPGSSPPRIVTVWD